MTTANSGSATSTTTQRNAAGIEPGRELRPLTERILDRLPGPPVAWFVVWALVPWANAGANRLLEANDRTAIWEQSRTLIVRNYAAVSFAVVMCLWGASRIARRVEALHEATSVDVDATAKFRAMDSTGGPLVLAVGAAIVFGGSALAVDGWLPGFLRAATWLAVGVPVWTFVWTYGTLQLGFHRLGRDRLLPDAASDPMLGMRPFGALAATALWMLLVWLIPLLVTGLPDIVGVVIGVAALAGALAAFFYSLYRIHRQMVEVKGVELARARVLYAEACEPVRLDPTLPTLDRQKTLLAAADALEQRADAIHEWPLDEGTIARVVTITTSVIAVVIARLILDPLGF